MVYNDLRWSLSMFSYQTADTWRLEDMVAGRWSRCAWYQHVIDVFMEVCLKHCGHAALMTALIACSITSIPALAASFQCVALHYPPLIFRDGNGEPAGLAYDIVARAFHHAGHSMSIQFYPWSRAQVMARAGATDCILTIFRNPEREHFLDFSNESLLLQAIYLYARQGHQVRFDGDLAAISQFRIGTAHKVDYGPRFEHMRPSLVIDEASTIELNFKKLAVGRIDLVVSNADIAATTLRSPVLNGYADRIVRLAVPIDYVPTHIAFSKARNLEPLRDAIDAELRKMAVSGETQRLIESYRIDSINGPAPVLLPAASGRK